MKAIWTSLAVLAACVAAASPASAAVYWTSLDNNSVGRANLDGSEGNHSFITGANSIQYVAVDAAHVYWGNADGGIGRANLDGSAVDQNFIPNVKADGVAVDGTHVYWTSPSAGAVGRANLDGSGVEPNLVTGLNFPVGIALDAGHVYWADQFEGTIGRAALDGSNPEKSFIAGLGGPAGLAADAGHLYWVSPADRTIFRAKLDGTGVEPLIAFIQSPQGVAVDAGHVYWTSLGLGANEIGRANLDGTNFEQHFITGAGGPLGVAVDGVSFQPPAPPSTTPSPAGTTPSPAGATSASPLPAATAVRPSISKLALTKRVFAPRRPGTTFSFRLDQAATIKVRIQRKLAGGGLRTKGTLSRSRGTGANRMRFTGRVSGRALKPGRYRAVFTATNAAGKSAPRALSFTIVAR
jgi:virginiamycin B lyase